MLNPSSSNRQTFTSGADCDESEIAWQFNESPALPPLIVADAMAARSLQIVDSEGRPRLRLSVEAGGAPAVVLLDKEERERVSLTFRDPDEKGVGGGASLVFYDDSEARRLALYGLESGGVIQFCDADEKAEGTLCNDGMYSPDGQKL